MANGKIFKACQSTNYTLFGGHCETLNSHVGV